MTEPTAEDWIALQQRIRALEAEEAPETPPSPQNMPRSNESEYEPFTLMLRLGVPLGAVLQRMLRDGRSASFITTFQSFATSPHPSNATIVTDNHDDMDTATDKATDTESESEVSHESIISHLLQFHSNKAIGIVDDIRDFTRPWRGRLRDILFRENEKYVKFLEKPANTWPALENHRSFFEELGRQTTSLGTSWLDKHVNPILGPETQAQILEEIDMEVNSGLGGLGGLCGLRAQIIQLMDNYLATLNKVFTFHSSLDHKITQMSRLKTQIEGLDFLEGDASSEAKELQTSALKFLQSKYVGLGIRDDYIGFCKEYARFMAYRSVLGAVQAGSDMHGIPICSICATGTVVSALVPCGHVYCNTCAQKQRSQCYICRTTVKGNLRIYFN